jgi:hypothetical protein
MIRSEPRCPLSQKQGRRSCKNYSNCTVFCHPVKRQKLEPAVISTAASGCMSFPASFRIFWADGSSTSILRPAEFEASYESAVYEPSTVNPLSPHKLACVLMVLTWEAVLNVTGDEYVLSSLERRSKAEGMQG